MSHKTILAAGILGLITCVVVFFVFLYTPTITIHLENDTSQQLTVSACGSDPATLNPGQMVNIDPNPNDPKAACVVYQGKGGQEIGCLYIPTTRFKAGSTVTLSAMNMDVSIGQCGD